MSINLKKLAIENKGFLIFLMLMFTFRSAVADWNIVPSESMRPTIQVGDRIWVNKLAYDIQLPFLYISLYRHSNPKRGDIVIFESAVSKVRLVKRVIGLPGDTVEMDNNHVILNGNMLPYKIEQSSELGTILEETIDQNVHKIRLEPYRSSPLASFPKITIPNDYYFVLGDNRDNSNDSRFISFIPRDEIIGRSSSVVMSHDFDNYYLPKKDRFFKSL